jgi:ribosomal protein L34
MRLDIVKLKVCTKTIVDLYGWSHNGQLGLCHRPGVENTKERIHGECIRASFKNGRKILEDREISEFNTEFDGVYFREIWDRMNKIIPVARMRLMRLGPMSCLSFHRDFEERFHIAVETNPYAFLLEGGQDYKTGADGNLDPQLKSYHIPDNGYVYKLDGYKRHCAMNGHGTMERIHLVMSLAVPYDASRR